MAVVSTDYYQPVSTLETSALDGLSVRAIHDIAAAVNNYQQYVACFPLIGEWGLGDWQSPDSATTDETALVSAGPFRVPDGFTKLCWVMGHWRIVGSGDVTWTLYCSENLYKGPNVFDSTYLKPGYGSATMVSGAWGIDTDQTCTLQRDDDGFTYLLITGTNTSGSQAQILHCDVAPIIA